MSFIFVRVFGIDLSHFLLKIKQLFCNHYQHTLFLRQPAVYRVALILIEVSSLVVTRRTADVLVTSDTPGTP